LKRDGSESRPVPGALRAAASAREKEVLSGFATPSDTGVRRNPEKRLESDYRLNFAVDVDRILHSLAYSRYIDKTQVFYLVRNDHITHRMLHVQIVSKVARTIGRYLGLNEDLIEAVAIGHDIGHTPFGHDGERFLSALCQSRGIGEYHHNVQSVEFLERVERKGKGWNLCLQTLDGILCHDGETHDGVLHPATDKTFAAHDAEKKAKTAGDPVRLVPMTLEGCVVRFSDTISYVGRDIEDAIRLGLIRRSDLPEACVRQLGNTNGTIVYNLVTDVITNSLDKGYVAFSGEASEALSLLKRFNYERIYTNPTFKSALFAIGEIFEELFDRYNDDIERENLDSPIYAGFIDQMAEDYLDQRQTSEIVRDFIAGMTDQYFLEQVPEMRRPKVMYVA